MKRNPRPFIQSAVADRVEKHFSRYSVKNHPQGGFTLAVQQPGTGRSIYEGSFGSKGAASSNLAERKSNAIAAIMKGRPADEVLGEKAAPAVPPDAQTGFGF